MASIKYAELVRHFRTDAEAASRELREALETKQIRVNDFHDLGSLFEECFGWEAYKACKSKQQLATAVMEKAALLEQGAVTTAAFQNISGQIVYSATLDAYQSEDFVFTKLIPEAQTQFLDGEKIAGITEIGDEAAVRNETEPYKLVGVGEDWVFTPPIKDRGMIVPVTWEAIFADRTGQLIERCSDVGKWLGVKVEKLAIDCCVDENTTAHRYNWRGTVIASYGNNSGTHTWDNLEASNALVDWTDVDNAEQLFNGLTDPYTGEPIMIEPRHLTVTKQLEKVALRIINATEIRVNVGGYATSGNLSTTVAPNPIANKYSVISSRLLAARMATDTTWFLADWSKYAKRMVAERMNVVQSPPNSHDEFHRQIVSQYRVNERSAFVVVQPRAAVQCTA